MLLCFVDFAVSGVWRASRLVSLAHRFEHIDVLALMFQVSRVFRLVRLFDAVEVLVNYFTPTTVLVLPVLANNHGNTDHIDRGGRRTRNNHTDHTEQQNSAVVGFDKRRKHL